MWSSPLPEAFLLVRMTPVEVEVQAQSPQRRACRKQLLKARAHAMNTGRQQKTHRTSIQRECELSDAARGRRRGCKHTINLSLVVAAPVLRTLCVAYDPV